MIRLEFMLFNWKYERATQRRVEFGQTDVSAQAFVQDLSSMWQVRARHGTKINYKSRLGTNHRFWSDERMK